jgi:hypothetical protein
MKCYYCEAELNFFTKSIDHAYPMSRGGIKNGIKWVDNKIWCCILCNRAKANHTPKEFYKKIKDENYFHHLSKKKRNIILKNLFKLINLIDKYPFKYIYGDNPPQQHIILDPEPIIIPKEYPKYISHADFIEGYELLPTPNFHEKE